MKRGPRRAGAADIARQITRTNQRADSLAAAGCRGRCRPQIQEHLTGIFDPAEFGHLTRSVVAAALLPHEPDAICGGSCGPRSVAAFPFTTWC